MAPRLRITGIIAAYNEADIIAQTVGYLVRQGIAAYVIDDQSTDGTTAALEPFMDTGLVHIEWTRAAQSKRFSWTQILTRKEQLAGALDADWFIHHDADEFRESPWPNVSLREGIELVDRLGYNAIDFAVLNFRPTDDRFDAGLDIRSAFRHYEPGEAFDRGQVKCWKKAEPVDLVSTGGHEAQFPSRRVFPIRFVLRHYPVRSQAHGTRKVFEERKPHFSNEERRRGWHVQYDALSPGHQFVRDPKSLHEYDPDAVRINLQIHHREWENLNIRLESARREMADQVSSLRDALARHRAEIAAAAAAHEQSRERLLSHIHDLERHARTLEDEILRLKQSWSWRITAPLRALWRLRK